MSKCAVMEWKGWRLRRWATAGDDCRAVGSEDGGCSMLEVRSGSAGPELSTATRAGMSCCSTSGERGTDPGRESLMPKVDSPWWPEVSKPEDGSTSGSVTVVTRAESTEDCIAEVWGRWYSCGASIEFGSVSVACMSERGDGRRASRACCCSWMDTLVVSLGLSDDGVRRVDLRLAVREDDEDMSQKGKGNRGSIRDKP